MRARTTPFSLDRHTEERLQHEIGLLGKRFVGKNAQFILEQQSSAKDYLPPGNHTVTKPLSNTPTKCPNCTEFGLNHRGRNFT
ncbi:hypothetical protein Pelo_13350 [Pelomyxa schiedti]|nr:hypothetical protein Pelo_13350 [Pelomyxa schiedti]